MMVNVMYVSVHTSVHFNQKNNLILNICESRSLKLVLNKAKKE
jgi:hypothetical protein